jgi:hypothetical protein
MFKYYLDDLQLKSVYEYSHLKLACLSLMSLYILHYILTIHYFVTQL